jgi:hypothetical protein
MPAGIDQLIVNSPYEEPRRFWRYDRESRSFSLIEGRRPAGYVVATPGSRDFDDPGQFRELPLPNRIRPRVVVRDDALPGARDYKSKLYHVAAWVKTITWASRSCTCSRAWRASSGPTSWCG